MGGGPVAASLWACTAASTCTRRSPTSPLVGTLTSIGLTRLPLMARRAGDGLRPARRWRPDRLILLWLAVPDEARCRQRREPRRSSRTRPLHERAPRGRGWPKAATREHGAAQ